MRPLTNATSRFCWTPSEGPTMPRFNTTGGLSLSHSSGSLMLPVPSQQSFFWATGRNPTSGLRRLVSLR